MKKDCISKHMPYPFYKAAKIVIEYLEKNKMENIQGYIDKINHAKYKVFEKGEKRKINFLIVYNFEILNIRKKYYIEFSGLSEKIIYGNYPYKMQNILILDTNKELKEPYTVLCAIHEILHLISCNKDSEYVYSGINIYEILEKKKEHVLLNYKSYSAINEAYTEQISYMIFESYYKDLKFEIVDICNGYFISTQILKLLNHTLLSEKEILDIYLNNKISVYEKRINSNLENVLQDLNNLLEKCNLLMQQSYQEISQNNLESLQKEVEEVSLYYILNLYNISKDDEYFKLCLNNKFFKKVYQKIS